MSGVFATPLRSSGRRSLSHCVTRSHNERRRKGGGTLLEALGILGGLLSTLLLGIELGRRLDKGRIGLSPDAVSRPVLDAELGRLERRVEMDLTDALDKLTHLDDRIRKRVSKPSEKPQDEPQVNGEGSRHPGNEDARRKLVALRGRVGTSASPSQGTE